MYETNILSENESIPKLGFGSFKTLMKIDEKVLADDFWKVLKK